MLNHNDISTDYEHDSSFLVFGCLNFFENEIASKIIRCRWKKNTYAFFSVKYERWYVTSDFNVISRELIAPLLRHVYNGYCEESGKRFHTDFTIFLVKEIYPFIKRWLKHHDKLFEVVESISELKQKLSQPIEFIE